MVYARVPRYITSFCETRSFSEITFSFLGGAFDPWGGPGYDACHTLTGPDFMNVFYKNNWAANEKLVSYYMVFGYVCLYDDDDAVPLTSRNVLAGRAGEGCPNPPCTAGVCSVPRSALVFDARTP